MVENTFQKVSVDQIQNRVFYRPENLILFSKNQSFVGHLLDVYEISTPFSANQVCNELDQVSNSFQTLN